MNLGGSLSRLGFDPQLLRHGLRTAAVAFLALLVAWLLGLEHPQWSAMTVFAASQPARNLLVEKSLLRAVGTVVGTALGVALMLASGSGASRPRRAASRCSPSASRSCACGPWRPRGRSTGRRGGWTGSGRSEADLMRRASREFEAILAFFTFSEQARLGR